jgi:DNA replication licensing factor MCM2
LVGNEESLVVSFIDLEAHSAILSYYVSACPIEVLPIFDEVALDVVLDWFEDYANIQKQVHVRISDLPVTETLRDLRQVNLNTLIKVSGVITKRTGVFPQLKYVKYDCIKCGALLGPFYQEPGKMIALGHCHSCSSKGPFEINSEQTVYQNFQKVSE